MKQKILIGVLTVLVVAGLCFLIFAPQSMKRHWKDLKSDYTGGLDRHLVVYPADGKILAEYDGKIDLEQNESGVVKFDYKGKRYMYYNCFVEVIEN